MSIFFLQQGAGATAAPPSPPTDDDTDTAVGTYVDCDGYKMRPSRYQFAHAFNGGRNADLTGHARLKLDLFQVQAVPGLPNVGIYLRILLSSSRAGENSVPRVAVLMVNDAPSPSRVREDTTVHNTWDGYEAGVAEWTFKSAANNARNADLVAGATDQDAWSINFQAPLDQTGRYHRVVLSTARAGQPSVPSKAFLTFDVAGEQAGTVVET